MAGDTSTGAAPDALLADHGALPYIVAAIGVPTDAEDICVELFRRLAPDTGMAFAVIPHAVAGANQNLLETLRRCTTMPVAEMSPGTRPKPNRVYVLTPGIRASLKRGSISLDGAASPRVRSIDHFFRSLAASQKNRAVGLVLSDPDKHGDGARGLRAIRDEGGVAMVHSSDTPDQIVRELRLIACRFQQSRPSPSEGVFEEDAHQSSEETALSSILKLLRGVFGVDFSVYKASVIQHRVARRMLLHDMGGAAEYAAFLQDNRKELGALHEDLWSLLRSGRFHEEERRRIARELHDNISQKLALLEMDAQQIEPRIAADPARAQEELKRVRYSIGALSEEVRRISKALNPSVIEDLGLTPAIRSLVEDFRDREDLMVTFRPDNVPDGIPLEVATGLYRIAQEALRNVARHAGRTRVRILLTGGPGRIRLQVIDSGKGFDPHRAHSSQGLIGMEERAQSIHGALAIESEPGEGTRVTVDVPLA